MTGLRVHKNNNKNKDRDEKERCTHYVCISE